MRCQPLLTPALLSSVTSKCKRFDEAVRYEELIAGRGEEREGVGWRRMGGTKEWV